MRGVLAVIVAALSVAVAACGGETSADPVTIVPIGDSLTQRVGASTYRCYLDEMLTEAGVEFDFVGALTQPASTYTCPTEFDRDHEAVNGAKIDNRAGPALASVERLQPDVALIALGGNDLIGGQPPTEIADELASFIQDLQVAQPDMTILVAQYPPCDYSSAWCPEGGPALHDAIEPMADRSTAQSTVIVVDMFTDFSLDDLDADGLHPNASGDEEMARRWMTALTDSGVIEAAPGTN